MQLSDLFDFSVGTIPVSIASALLAVWGWAKLYANKRMEHEFNKRLEKHKVELQNLRDINNFDLGRKMQDFNLYTTKRHEVYPELLSLYLAVGKKIGEYRSARYRYPIEHLTTSQLEHLLVTVYGIPKEHYGHLLTGWEKKEDALIEDVYETIDDFAWANMRNTINAAHNKTLMKELYLSSKVAKLLYTLSRQLYHYTDLLNQHFNNFESEPDTDMKKAKEDIESTTEEVKNLMRDELGIGDYDNTKVGESCSK